MQKRPPASVEVNRLGFRYSGSTRPALTELGFRIAPGERVGLLGPNGAGKSTLMRILCGYLSPEGRGGQIGGSVRVAGLDVRDESLAVRQQVGYLPELVPLYPELRVREHLEFRAAIKNVRRRERTAECRRVTEATGLLDMVDTPIGKLSRGYRQRVGIADALLGAPPLVVLDEPTVGLDPNQIQAIRAMLGELGGEQTLLFSSHVLAEVEELCDRILILSQGRIVADETVKEALSAGLVIELACEEGPARQLVSAVLRDFAVEPQGERETVVELHSESLPGRTRVTIPGITPGLPPSGLAKADQSGEWGSREDALSRALGQAALAGEIAILRLASGRRRLEERFARATGFGEELARSGGGSGSGSGGVGSGELAVHGAESGEHELESPADREEGARDA